MSKKNVITPTVSMLLGQLEKISDIIVRTENEVRARAGHPRQPRYYVAGLSNDYQVIDRRTNTEVCVCSHYEGQHKPAFTRARLIAKALNQSEVLA